MKILADVNISPRIVARLRAEGFDAVRVGTTIAATSSDQAVLAEAAQHGAVLVSRGQDFSALLAITGARSPSLVNVRTSSVDQDHLAERLAAVIRGTSAELAAGAVVTLDDAGVRVHRLPIE
ncbi:MAG: DUF5615 family PIN-like protein [Polyangiaceae bacterium]|nr:DUF5615 family PIN-like protein [Polyangiaceae bacterium]